MAEHEAEMISLRTKGALAVLKVRGVKLGRPNTTTAEMSAMSALGTPASVAVRRRRADAIATDMLPLVMEMRKEAGGDLSLRQIATRLNLQGETTPGGKEWTATQVMRLLAREGKVSRESTPA